MIVELVAGRFPAISGMSSSAAALNQATDYDVYRISLVSEHAEAVWRFNEYDATWWSFDKRRKVSGVQSMTINFGDGNFMHVSDMQMWVGS